jgi:hypothetical protein
VACGTDFSSCFISDHTGPCIFHTKKCKERSGYFIKILPGRYLWWRLQDMPVQLIIVKSSAVNILMVLEIMKQFRVGHLRKVDDDMVAIAAESSFTLRVHVRPVFRTGFVDMNL